ncbi:MAG: hypothetical protein EBR92_03625, partial [Alphaproteobacteria bacterium]|nr:hypothetical protein [Alphaproteobacteria bacterium]
MTGPDPQGQGGAMVVAPDHRADNDAPTVPTGILQICFAMLLVPVLDVFAKLLGQTLNPVEVTLMRFIMQSL